jgi:hypothetical protein
MPPASLTHDDYMDEDVAYLVGMLFGRGQLIEERDVRRLIITLDIRRKTPKLPPGVTLDVDLERENERALNQCRSRINKLLDADVEIEPQSEAKSTMVARFQKPTIGWRLIRMLCNGTDRGDFRLPEFFFELDREHHQEFLRGFADVAVMPSFADNAWGSRARVAFPVVHRNEAFADQLVQVFSSVGIEAPRLPGSASARGSEKEHRIRPYADDYVQVGFHFKHKQRLLEVLAEYNRRRGSSVGEE